MRELEPFWRTGKMYRESVAFRRTSEGIAATLLYAPEGDVKAERPGGGEVKAKFRVSGRTLFWEGGEEVPVLTDAQYWGEEGDPDALAAMKRFHVAKPYYSEFFPASRQSLVSYSFRAGKECPPTANPSALARSRERLRAGGAFRVVTYGDSIGQGMTSSKLMGIAPHLPTFSEMFAAELERISGANVSLCNVSEGGMTSGWGVEHMSERLPEDGDLYLFCWGMNDGSADVPPEVFAENISALRAHAGANADCILISPMLPNPDAELTTGGKFLNRQPDYADALRSLSDEDCAVADMTAFHRWLLSRKPYFDLTGNNINHPNDFLARCYAMNLLEAVTGPARSL